MQLRGDIYAVALVILEASVPPPTRADLLLPVGETFEQNTFRGINSIAADSTAEHLYACAEGKVIVLQRDAGTGLLTVASTAPDALLTNGCPDLALSPDGAFLYAASGSSIEIFARDSITGSVAATGSVAGNVSSLAISPDGAQLYACGQDGEGVDVFARDALTGGLSMIESQGVGTGIPTLHKTQVLALSPDGAHLYVSAYQQMNVFARTAMTGHLTFVASHFEFSLYNHQPVVVSADGRNVYATFAEAVEGIFTYARDLSTGDLTKVGTTQYDSHAFVGSLLEAGDFVYLGREGDDLYPPGRINVFARSAVDGTLTPVQEILHHGLSNPTDLLIAPGGQHMYSAAPFEQSIALLERDVSSGTLAFVQGNHAPGHGIGSLHGIALSPDGTSVYGVSHNLVSAYQERSIAVFARDAASGLLSHEQSIFEGEYGAAGLNGGDDVVVSPDGRSVYTAANTLNVSGARDNNGEIGVFSRDAATGRLTFLEVERQGAGGVDGLKGVTALAISPDGLHLYAASPFRGSGPGFEEAALAVFARDPTTGALLFIEAYHQGVAGIDGLTGVGDIAVSPDGRHVYAVGLPACFFIGCSLMGRVSSFSRDASTGTLTFAGAMDADLQDAAGPSIAISADGAYVYVGHLVLSRDLTSGQLTLLESNPPSRRGGVPLLAEHVVLSPDGNTLYRSGGGFKTSPDGVAELSRDPATGLLTYRQSALHGEDGAIGLDIPVGRFAVSPDSKFVYGVSRDGIITVLKHISLCPAQPAPICLSAVHGALSLRNNPSHPNSSFVRFQWLNGEDTTGGDLGDPVTATSYALCLYDQSGGSPTLRNAIHAPSGESRWKLLSSGSTLRYSDPLGTPEGWRNLKIRTGSANTSRLKMRAVGRNLPALPTAALTLPVTVQVVNSDGTCFGASFTAPDVSINTSTPSLPLTFVGRH